MWLDPGTWPSAAIGAFVALLLAASGVLATRALRRFDDLLKERESFAIQLLERLDSWGSPRPILDEESAVGYFTIEAEAFGYHRVYLNPPDAWDDPAIRALIESGVDEDELISEGLIVPGFYSYDMTSEWDGGTAAAWLATGATRQPPIEVPPLLRLRQPNQTQRVVRWYLASESRFLRLSGHIVVKPDGDLNKVQSTWWERQRSASDWENDIRRALAHWAKGRPRASRWAVYSFPQWVYEAIIGVGLVLIIGLVVVIHFITQVGRLMGRQSKGSKSARD